MNLEEQIYYSCAAYSMIHPNRAAVLNHLFCVIGNGYEWENGELVECCGDTTTKSGRRLSLKASINQVFRNRRKHAEFTRREARRWKREEKKNPDKALDGKLDKLIEAAVAAERKAREADPEAYEAKKKKQEAEWAATRKKWKAEQRWEYRVPTDIEKRVKDTKFDHWYPVCEYSRMVTFPDDVKDEWLDAIIETATLVCGSYDRFERGEGPAFGSYPNDPDGSVAKRVTRQTFVEAHKALYRANELKAARKRVYFVSLTKDVSSI
jgi:hypothetical protein